MTAAVALKLEPASWLADARDALAAVEGLYNEALASVRARVTKDGKLSNELIEADQHAAHGLAWFATYVQGLKELIDYAERLTAEGAYGETEELLNQIGYAELLAQVYGGIPMSQGEIVRLSDFGLSGQQVAAKRPASVDRLILSGNTPANRARLAELIDHHAAAETIGATGLDETLEAIRSEMRKFAADNVTPFAQEWHAKNEYIPLDVISGLAELGVFGLTIPEEYGGSGMGKIAMCVVSEELSRGWIGVGSLGTRSEIAAELILTGGTDAQKAKWLPIIANADLLPTAVFTEPDTGSDLGALRTRAVLENDCWFVTGNKTWITHAARADMMTLMVRTNPETRDHSGLSMLLAPKQRGTVENPFPTPGMSGGEIEVIGYRGMKEYEIGFDRFQVPAENLLGGIEGQGFKQLMATFESARIQTAARAIGVAQAALDIALAYALDRKQFGRPIFEFPRVANKLAMMAAELMGARQLTYFAARAKDEGKRCDLEAGMAKLIGARVAWAAADNALQIHGGNGFATEYVASRLLADARILNIFEGAGEIQAQVIARRLLDESN
jgi:(2S)-methylsuccinyl-CoA dehydrogenase